MKQVLMNTKRILAVMLSVAMIFAYVPETVFTYGANVTDETVEQMPEETSEQASEQIEEPSSEAPSEEPTTEAAPEIEEEPITEKAGAGAEAVIEDGENITDEKEDAVKRVLYATGGDEFAGDNDMTIAYGTEGKKGTYKITSDEFTGGHTSFEYEILGAKDYKRISEIDAYVNTGASADLNSAYALLESKALPEGLSAAKSDSVITISGTPSKIVQDTGKKENVWYLVVKDTAGASAGDTYTTGLMVIKKFIITINDATVGAPTSSIAARLVSGTTVQFGEDTDDATPSTTAKAGYTVSKIKQSGAVNENVKPVTLTWTNSNLDPALGDKVTATIVEFSSENNDNSTVQKGDEAINAFTVAEGTDKGTGHTATTTKNFGSGQNAVFTVAPAEGLTAKVDTGTTYKAKLKLTSKMFRDKEYTLQLTVTNGVAITSVIAHGGLAPANTGAAGDPYDLGTFKVGETINDVVIKAANGSGDMSFDADYTTQDFSGTDDLSPLPSGIKVITTTSGEFKLTNMVAAADYAMIGQTRYFALTPKDSLGVVGTKKYFKYAVAQADVEVSLVKGAYSETKATKLTVGGDNAFNWFGTGKTGTDLEKEYVTVYIKNKSDIPLTFRGAVTTTAAQGSFVFDPETTSTTGVTVPAKKDSGSDTASFKIVPGGVNASNKAIQSLTLSAQGVINTTVTNMTYEALAAFTITKPAHGSESPTPIATADIDTAYVGKAYSYSFEETHPKTVSSVIWTITSITDGTGTTTVTYTSTPAAGEPTAAKYLEDTYGLAMKADGELAGILKKATALTSGELTLIATATPSTGTAESVQVSLPTVANADGVKLTRGETEIKNAATVDFGTVALDGVVSAKAEVGLKNNTSIKQEGVKLAISAIKKNGGTTGITNNEFKVVYDENNKAQNAALTNTGLTLAATSGEAKIVIAPDIDELQKDANRGPGVYTMTVTMSSTEGNFVNKTFTAKFAVTDVPKVTVSNTTPLVVGTAYSKASGKNYTATYNGNAVDCTYETISGTIPGVTLTDEGYYTGNPTKAGIYEVTVKATTKGLSTNVSNTFTHKITVNGTATLTVRLSTATATALENKTYVLPGEVVDNDAKSDKLGLVVVATGDDAEGMTVTVEDAKDDRNPADADDAADMVKNPGNPYEGSKNVIGVGTIASTIKKDAAGTLAGETFYVTTKKTTKAGLYKVTVTVAGTNATPVKFDLVMVVAGKLAIHAPSTLTAQVGDALGDTNMVLTAEGGCTDQKVVWSETGTSVKDPDNITRTKFFVTKDATTQGTKSDVTDLLMTVEADKIGAEDGVGLKTNITGTPKLAGSFTVNTGAKVNAMALADIAGTDKTKIAILRSETLNTGNGFPIVNKTAAPGVMPEQTAASINYTMTINKSKNPQISDLAIGGKSASAGNLPGTIQGTALGNKYSNITGYTFASVTPDYNTASHVLTVTVTGGDGALLKATGKLNNTNFVLAPTSEQTLAAAGTTFTLTPATLPVGSHSSIFTLTGDNIEPLTLNLTFVVENPTYKATIDNNIDATETDPETLKKREEYAKDVATGTASKGLTMDTVIEKKTGAKTYNVAVRNTGNTIMYDTTIVEASKDGSGWVDETVGADQELTVTGGTSANIAVSGKKLATVKVKDTTVRKGVKAKALHITFHEKDDVAGVYPSDDVKHDIYVPVNFVVLNEAVETVSVTPAADSSGYVVIPSKDESYTRDQASVTFTMSNTYSGAGAAAETIKGAYATLGGADAAHFKVTSLDLDKADIEAGKNATFTVSADPGLSPGTYRASVTFNGGNLASGSAITKDIEFKVTASDNITIDRITDGAPTTTVSLDKSKATRLYNSLVVGIGTNDSLPKVTVGAASATAVKVTIDFDNKLGAGDIEVDFTGTGLNGAVGGRTITGATVTLSAAGTRTITSAPDPLSLNETHKANAEAGVDPDAETHKSAYFKTIQFLPYVTATLGTAGTTVYTATENSLKNDFLSFNVSGATVGGDGEDKNNFKGQIIAQVPLGAAVSSVFNTKKLPVAVVGKGKVNKGWILADGETVVTDSYTAVDDVTINVNAYTYKYSKGSSKTTDAGVKWVWTKDSNGGATAVLSLTDISGEYDAESLITINKDTKAGDNTKGYPFVAAPINFQNLGVKAASCDKGSGRTFKATATITDWDPTANAGTGGETTYTYTSEYVVDDAGDAPGHEWGDPVIVWATKGSGTNGAYTAADVTVTRTCRKDSTHVAKLTIVSVNENITKQPTCTEEGEATYSVTYKDVDKYGKDASNVTDTTTTKKTVIAAKGHTYNLVIGDADWNDDHRTAKAAKLVCTACAEGTVGHTVDVLANVTYTITENADKTVAQNIAKVTYDGKEYTVEWNDDILYDPQVTISWPQKYNKGDAFTTATWTGTVKSQKNNGAQKNISGVVTVTPSPVEATDKRETIEFTGTVDLSMYYKTADKTSGKADNKVEKMSYFFKDGGIEGISKKYTFKSVKKWNWPKELPVGTFSSITAVVTYSVEDMATQKTTDEDVETTATVTGPVVDGKNQKYTAKLTTYDGLTKEDVAKYNSKGKLASDDDNETESEPEQSEVDNYKSYNLFYNDMEIPVEGLSAALSEAGAASSGKWTQFFKADGDAVTVIGDAKKAVNASNSLITVTYDGGQFNYQLPVYYQKPSLKLTSAKGTILKGKTEATKLHTTVTEKKSNGLYEALEIAAEDVTFAPNSGKSAPEGFAPGSNDGEIEIDAKAATAGKINVKKENWRETIALSYQVKESTKDVITADTNTVTLNTKAETVEAQTVEIKLNGEDLSDENKVTVTPPANKWSKAGVEGIEAGDLTDGKLSLSLVGDATHTKGTYNVKFTSANKGSFTLKVVISETETAKAFKLNVKSKMDVTRGQKMVLEPKFNGASGPITDVKVPDSSKFTAEWVEAKNQIVVGVADGASVAKGKNNETFTITSGGADYAIPLSFQVNAAKPTVKLAKVTLPKSKVTGEDGAEGKTNINATYKQNGKTFGIAPTEVKFMVGKNAAEESKEETGWYVVETKNNVLAQYDEATGVINVKVKNTTGKAGSVKVSMTFPGGANVTKTFTVGVK